MELCPILYSDEYKATMATLQQYLQDEVYTEEALNLTEQVLELLASHYTAWQYRYNIIKHLKKDLFEELDWCELVALENEKNYQIWNYRQRIIEDILASDDAAKFDYRREFPILRMMLQEDTKNHHVWTYRKWLVQRFCLFDDAEELEFVENVINGDLRNNSGWSHRFFLKAGSKDGFRGEEDYCRAQIAICPQNPSSWNYLVGMFKRNGRSLVELKDLCEEYGDVLQEKISSTFAVETLAKIAEEEDDRARALELYGMLGDKYDIIRANYWKHMSMKIEPK